MAFIEAFFDIFDVLKNLDFSDSKVKDLNDLITILNRDGQVRVERNNGSMMLSVDEFIINGKTLLYTSYYNDNINKTLRCTISKLNNLLQDKGLTITAPDATIAAGGKKHKSRKKQKSRKQKKYRKQKKSRKSKRLL